MQDIGLVFGVIARPVALLRCDIEAARVGAGGRRAAVAPRPQDGREERARGAASALGTSTSVVAAASTPAMTSIVFAVAASAAGGPAPPSASSNGGLSSRSTTSPAGGPVVTQTPGRQRDRENSGVNCVAWVWLLGALLA